MKLILPPILILTVGVACGSNAPPASRTFVETRAAPRGPDVELPPPEDATASNVVISADIRRACGIPDTQAFFSYDSASIRNQDRAILKTLADCFTTGPLTGRQMRLVGHADPRGDEEYNHVLGQRRADNVKSAVVEAGMATGSIATSSRGEDEASGAEEIGWAKDRRVEIHLGT